MPGLVLACSTLLVSNLLLQTPWVRGWFEGKLERRSGLDWTIGRLSWTPWSGVQVEELEAALTGPDRAAAEPLCAVEQIDVLVDWGALVQGDIRPREVRMRKGRVALPVELMALLQDPRQAAGDLDLAKNNQEAEPEEKIRPKPPQKKTKKPVAKKQGKRKQDRKRSDKATRRGAKPVKPDDPVSPPAGRPFVVFLENFDIHLYSIGGGGKRRLALRDVQAELPLSGEDASGFVQASKLTMGEEVVAGEWKSAIVWRRPVLQLPPTRYEWAGLPVDATASLRVRPVPLCSVQVRIDPAPLAPTAVAGVPGVEVSARETQLNARFQGNLLAPQTWRGDAIAQVEDLRITQEDRGDGRIFEHGRLTSVLRGRTMRVVDARLRSEQLSFLGNGLLLPDGRMLGVLRVVADRENAEAITKMAVGSFLSGGWTRSWLAPLETPDRQYRDIHVRGTVEDATVDVGKQGEEVDVDLAWKRVVAFVRDEVAETKRGVDPSPARERIIPQ